jgi:diacylglycerol kinase family enzyme
MPSHPAIILNASSGAGDKEQARAALAQALQARGHDAFIWLARSGAELLEYARRAVREDCHPVVAGGGDGTINAVASVLVGTDRPLGVLPLGTLNHFAKDLRIPLDLESAIKVCLDEHTAQVDVGEVNGRIFLNNSSLGLYPSIVRQRERQQEREGRGKWPAFFWAALAVLRRYPFMDVRLSTDRKDFRRRTPFVFIGNNEYQMEGFGLGERARLDAGQLSLTVAHRTGRLGLLRFAVRALFGGLRNEKDFDALSTKEVWVETKRSRLRVATDGEVTIMHTPLHYRVRPGALRVLVPSKSSDESRAMSDE